jgi:Tfp pilus assembly protein PilF
MRSCILALCTLTLLCVRAHADSTPAWLQVTTPHFTVVTDAGEKQARHIAGQFERMQAVFHKILPAAHSDTGTPIVVLAVKNRRDFQALEPAEYLTKGKLDLAGLFLQSNDRCYILVRLDAGGDHPYSTVYHEYTHYITRHANLPLWLNEGIAEFYQNTDIDSHEIRFGQPSPGYIQILRSQSLLPLPTLFNVDHDSPYYHEEQKGTMFYSEAWALTYMLYINDFRNKTNLIGNYVKALSSGQTSLAAAVTAFGDLKSLEGALDVQIGHSDFPYLTLPISIPVDEASFAVTSLTSADADAYRATVLVADDRTDDARKLLASVLAANPSNAIAYESEAMLHLREHDLEAARESYVKAAAAHSTSFLAWYYAGVLTLRSGNHDDPAIETNLQQAIKLNPNFAPAYDALAGYYAVHRKLDDALHLSILAITLEPDNFTYRLNNASIHMQRDEFPSALSVLEAARPLAHTPAELAELKARVNEVHLVQDQLAAAANAAAAPATVSTSTVTYVDTNDPHYPDAAPTGPHHTIKGVLHNVQCSYPTILTLTVDSAPKPIALYTNHMYKIDYFAGNFYPKGGLDPCKIEGMKAVVTYTDVKDARVAGQIVSIMVNK